MCFKYSMFHEKISYFPIRIKKFCLFSIGFSFKPNWSCYLMFQHYQKPEQMEKRLHNWGGDVTNVTRLLLLSECLMYCKIMYACTA